MSKFQKFLNELSLYSYDKTVPSKGGELAFMRLIIKMINEINPENNYKKAKSDKPFNIVFGDGDKNITINGVVLVTPTGRDTTSNKKADFVFTKQDGTQVPVSLKHTDSGTYSKFRPVGEKLKKYLINKGIDIKVPILFKLPDKMTRNAVFGSDILPNGFVFKFNRNFYEKVDENTFFLHGNVITDLSEIDEDDLPVLTISAGSVPEIRTKGKQGKLKKINKLDDEFVRKYMSEFDTE